MKRIFRTLVLLSFLTTSCIKERLEVTYNNQEDKIDQYISNNMYVNKTEDGINMTDTLRVVHRNGANRLITKEGIGDALESGGTIAFYYAGYVFNGNKSYSNLFITNHKETAQNAGWSLTDENTDLYLINLGKTELLDGLRNGLLGVRSGEECQILFSGKYGFGKKEFGIIPANSALLFEIWVESISND